MSESVPYGPAFLLRCSDDLPDGSTIELAVVRLSERQATTALERMRSARELAQGDRRMRELVYVADFGHYFDSSLDLWEGEDALADFMEKVDADDWMVLGTEKTIEEKCERYAPSEAYVHVSPEGMRVSGIFGFGDVRVGSTLLPAGAVVLSRLWTAGETEMPAVFAELVDLDAELALGFLEGSLPEPSSTEQHAFGAWRRSLLSGRDLAPLLAHEEADVRRRAIVAVRNIEAHSAQGTHEDVERPGRARGR